MFLVHHMIQMENIDAQQVSIKTPPSVNMVQLPADIGACPARGELEQSIIHRIFRY